MGAAERLADLPPTLRARVRRTMRWAVVEGSLAQVFLNWTTGSVLVGFMLHLGASPTELALVAAVPHLSQLASPVAAFLAAALGRRKALTAAMGVGSRLTWLAAAAVPMLPVADAARPWLVVAVGVGLLGVAVYALQADPATRLERVRWRELVSVPLRDRPFRRYLTFTVYWNFVVMLSGPFVTPFYLQELGMTFTQVAIASALTATTALATTPLWGRVADRVGHRPVLALGTGVAGFAGGALAGPLLLGLGHLEASAFGGAGSGYLGLFTVAALLRLQAWWWLRPVGWSAWGTRLRWVRWRRPRWPGSRRG